MASRRSTGEGVGAERLIQGGVLPTGQRHDPVLAQQPGLGDLAGEGKVRRAATGERGAKEPEPAQIDQTGDRLPGATEEPEHQRDAPEAGAQDDQPDDREGKPGEPWIGGDDGVA